jgi:hypothetical protein
MSREIARRPPKAAKNRFDVALGSVSVGGPVHSRPVALVNTHNDVLCGPPRFEHSRGSMTPEEARKAPNQIL